ncbi:hypothetical protein Bbelb_122830 [Branchiostoma belcheri]|nr:hypothetical protein Bbelb_122830 [Branchiostoma belcheri]
MTTEQEAETNGMSADHQRKSSATSGGYLGVQLSALNGSQYTQTLPTNFHASLNSSGLSSGLPSGRDKHRRPPKQTQADLPCTPAQSDALGTVYPLAFGCYIKAGKGTCKEASEKPRHKASSVSGRGSVYAGCEPSRMPTYLLTVYPSLTGAIHMHNSQG